MNSLTLLTKKNLGRFARVTLASFTLASAGAAALPSGGSVTAGNATLGTVGNTVTVNQTSRAAVVSWHDFSVGREGLVHFENGAGATLNRVTGNLPSHIDGTITATGSVYLVNPAGVVVGASGIVRTGGSFVASTLDVADAAFLAGGDLSFAGTSDALVVNAGRIGALGGDVALIARRVENAGDISAARGSVGLLAGYEVLVRDGAHADGKFLVKVGGSDTAAVNSGTLSATAAELRANGGNVYALAGNTGGLVRATRVDTSGGRIVFDAGDNGSVTVAGKADASSASGKGGSVIVTGSRVAVKSGAVLDASGTTGGNVLVGGDYQGGKNGPTYAASKLLNALVTEVDAGATLVANGSATGKGGDIVVWADDHTAFSGAISATGLRGGDAEVSGKNSLVYAGTADLRGATGFGELLLDPADITISNAGSDTNFAPTGASSNISVAALTSALATANVTVTTTTGSGGAGNITVADAISWSSASKLTLQADNNIVLNAGITAANGSLTLSAVSTLNNTTGIAGISGGSITTGANGTIAIGGVFTLQQGTWYQIGALPAFYAKDFRIMGNGTTNTAFFLRFAGGDGVASGSAYRIADIYGLQGVAGGETNGSGSTLANAATLGSYNLAPIYYTLANDIDASVTSTWNSGAGFRPIGGVGTSTGLSLNNSLRTSSGGRAFSALFDGAMHTVSGLTMNRTSDTFTGVFGYVYGNLDATRGVVSNLALANARVTGRTADVGAPVATGAVVANSYRGTFSGLRVTGTVVTGGGQTGGLLGYADEIGALADSSFTGGSVSGTSNVGGLVGGASTAVRGVIARSFSATPVSGTGNRVGGIAGALGGLSMEDLYSTGNVTGAGFVGGLAGHASVSESQISRVYTTSRVTGGGTEVAALIGSNAATVTLAYWNTQTANQSNASFDAATGAASTTGMTGLTTAQMGERTNFSGFDFTTGTGVWNAPAGGPPTLQVFNAPAVTNITYAFTGGANWTYGDTPVFGGVNGVNFSLTGVASGDTANVTGVVGAQRQGGSTVVSLSHLLGAGTYTLSLTGLSGSAASKYAIATTGNTTGTLVIAPAALTIVAGDLGKTYGDLATLTDYTINGLKGSDTVGSVTLTSAGAAATAAVGSGSYAITASGATGGTFDANNYAITYTPGTLTVNKAALTLTANHRTKTRGDTLTFAGTEFAASGLKNGDTVGSVTLTSAGAASGAAIGGYAIAISAATGGTFDAGNYTLAYTPGTLTVVSDKNVNYVVGSTSSTYGTLADLSGVSVSLSGLDVADQGVVTGVLGVRDAQGRAVTLAALTNAGTYSLVVASLTGTNSQEYRVVDVGSTAGVLTVNRLAVSIASQATLAGSRTYDGTTGVLIGTAGTLAGIAAGDTGIGLALTANFADKNVGADKAATGSYALTGASAANYDLVGPTTFSGIQTVTAKSLAIGTAGTVAGKVYDGTTAATVATNGALTGVLSGDTVTLALAAAYADRNAGANKTVNGTYAISGTDAANYALSSDTFAGTAAITPKSLTAAGGSVVASREYDGTGAIGVTGNGTLTGVLAGDTVTLALAAAYADKNAGANKTVNGTYTISGADAANYTLASNAFTGVAAITPKGLSIASQATVSGTKVYDGTTSILVTAQGTLTGVIAGDTVTLALTGAAYADKNVGTGKTVNGAYALSGAGAANYVLTSDGFSGVADITPATLTYTAAAATRLSGDANPVFSGSVAGFVSGETQATATTGALAFTSPAGTSSPDGNYAILGSGLSATNYVFVQAAGNATALTVRGVTAGGIPLPDARERAALRADNPALPTPPSENLPPRGFGPIAPLVEAEPTAGAGDTAPVAPDSENNVHPDNRRIGANIVFVSGK